MRKVNTPTFKTKKMASEKYIKSNITSLHINQQECGPWYFKCKDEKENKLPRKSINKRTTHLRQNAHMDFKYASESNFYSKTGGRVYNIHTKTAPKLVDTSKLTITSMDNALNPMNNAVVNSEIKKKVDSCFREVKPYQVMSKTLLNQIVFDPDQMQISSKRKLVTRTSDKSLVRKFEKPLKSSRVLLRVGGVRLSLQDYQRKVAN